MQLHPIHEALISFAQPDRINDFMRYFQTFEGGYAEGDTFMGVMVPDRQKVAKAYFDQWDERVLRSGLVPHSRGASHGTFHVNALLWEGAQTQAALARCVVQLLRRHQ